MSQDIKKVINKYDGLLKWLQFSTFYNLVIFKKYQYQFLTEEIQIRYFSFSQKCQILQQKQIYLQHVQKKEIHILQLLEISQIQEHISQVFMRLDNQSCQMAFYNINSYLKKSGTSFGVGQRSDFTRTKSVAPGCTKYSPQTQFGVDYNRGPGFGVSREKAKEFGHIIQGILNNPSPNQYRNNGLYTRVAYSIGKKSEDKRIPNFLQQNYKTDTPGPGEYKSSPVKPKGLPKQTEERFFLLRPSTPGPGQYNIPDLANDILSNKNKKGHLRLSDTRISFFDQVANQNRVSPGPGHYRMITDFDDPDIRRFAKRSRTETDFL
ncbi:hypothetical protein pb186bvf_007800 [Paramecium bursaria]